MDGNGFSIAFYFEDGKNCAAHGSNAYPKNYKDFCSGMEELMRPLAADIEEQCRQKFIAEGLGEITGIMLEFLQKGKSGSDKYSFHIYKTDREELNNLDITIQSVSGDFLPAGDYKYVGHLDEKDLDFSGIKKIIEKHRLCEWQYYHAAAKDYNNAEWFQIAISFGDGKLLSAMGTEKPDRYDEFRREFLSYMVEFIESIKSVYKPYK